MMNLTVFLHQLIQLFANFTNLCQLNKLVYLLISL